MTSTRAIAVLVLQPRQHVEDLGLDRDVEGGGRLVGDEQLRLVGQAIAIITRWRMPPDSSCG